MGEGKGRQGRYGWNYWVVRGEMCRAIGKGDICWVGRYLPKIAIVPSVVASHEMTKGCLAIPYIRLTV